MNFAAYDMETTPVSQALADAASAPFLVNADLCLLITRISLRVRQKGELRLIMTWMSYWLTWSIHSLTLFWSFFCPIRKIRCTKKDF